MDVVADLPLAGEGPADLDPLADGILMAHQVAWLSDQSPLKLMEKGRRTGITWCEALDDTIIAASAGSAGGDNVFYIGDTREKGLEFCRTCAHFARFVAAAVLPIEEFVFEDRRDDGESKHIAAYRIRFASGFQIVGLSSRPANIRGLQGIVVIDEAAFHRDVMEVLAAVNALLIWGGRIRIISTHNGDDNPFNLLIQDSRKGLYDYSLHRVTFDDAVAAGLYERVCLIRGWEASEVGRAQWYDRILRSYGADTEARDEELFVVPRKGSGVYFTRAMIRQCAEPGIPIVRMTRPEAWYLDEGRLDDAAEWFERELAQICKSIPQDRRTVFGQDFGRDGDLSVIWVLQEEPGGGRWRTVVIIELRRVPFDVQQWLLFALIDALPMCTHGKLDARGNGQSHAEQAQQRYGIAQIDCVKATAEWYAIHCPEYRAAYEDRSIIVPDHEDLVLDHRQVLLVRGRPAMDEKRVRGADGEPRHGDTAIAGVLAWAAAGEAAAAPIEFRAGGDRVSLGAYEAAVPGAFDTATAGRRVNWRGY
jgi:phage FluMu gp28-like protein